MIVFVYILALEILVFWYFQNDIICMMTTIEDLRLCILNVYPLFLINIVFAGLTGVLRGPIYALGLMRKLTFWNIFFYGIALPCCMYYFLKKLDYGMNGIWFSKVLVEASLLISYTLTLMTSDWN